MESTCDWFNHTLFLLIHKRLILENISEQTAMKAKEHNRQGQDYALNKFKAQLGDET